MRSRHRMAADPQARAVRLSPANNREHSLTPVTVAAHEIGHAIS